MIFVNLYVSVIPLFVNVYKKSPVNGDGQIKRAATVHNWTGRNIMKQQHNVRPAIRRVLQATAIVTAAALTLAGCSMGAPSSDTGSSDGKLTVWVMQGDQSEATIKAINDQFTKETGVEVNIQNQQWKDISTKITTALSTSTPPDVLDLGNTQVAGFAASGGLMDLTDHADELRQGVTWLSGLEEPATVDGKLYGIPALGAARAVVYNKKTWAAAGINEPPTTYAELEADLQILKDAHQGEDFTPFYVPGADWKTAIQWVWDAGGDYAVQKDGKWVSSLSTKESVSGLEQWREFQHKWSSEASRPLDTDSPDTSQLMAEGKIGAVIGNSASIRVIQEYNKDITADELGSFPMPGLSGQNQPSMMAGSVWGVAQKSSKQDLALKWIKIASSPDIQNDYVFAKDGYLPNNVEGLDKAMASDDFPTALTGFFEAAKRTKATPASPQWTTIESDGSLTLFKDIATDTSKAEASAKKFDEHANELYAK